VEKNKYKEITVIIVTFKSDHIIHKCLKNIDENFKIILIENSDNHDFTSKLEKEYKNLKCINMGYDAGYGSALNVGIKLSKTDFVICINPDSFPDRDCFEKLLITSKSQENIALVAPLTLIKNNTQESSAYGFFSNKKDRIKNSQNNMFVDWVHGNVFLLNKKIMDRIGYFDENIFIEFDEIDLQQRIFKAGKKTVINFNAKSQHLEGKSADPKYSFEMKCEHSWHHSWSKFYYFKKHFGYIKALKECLPRAILDIIKSIVFFILLDKKKTKIYILFFLGFFNSFIGKKSFYRAILD